MFCLQRNFILAPEVTFKVAYHAVPSNEIAFVRREAVNSEPAYTDGIFVVAEGLDMLRKTLF